MVLWQDRLWQDRLWCGNSAQIHLNYLVLRLVRFVTIEKNLMHNPFPSSCFALPPRDREGAFARMAWVWGARSPTKGPWLPAGGYGEGCTHLSRLMCPTVATVATVFSVRDLHNLHLKEAYQRLSPLH